MYSVNIPCIPGDTVYYFVDKHKKVGRRKIPYTTIEHGVVDNVQIGNNIDNPSVSVCNDDNEWMLFQTSDFEKIIFTDYDQALHVLNQK